MTVPVCYTSEGRRYTRYPPYYPERRYLPSHEHAHAHAGRTTIMTEREAEGENNPPRKRIAVACMRCRKRKIRCSGDPGNGQPCNNCKNAGTEPCRFLRVSSQETPLRHDSNDFNFDLGQARAYQTRTAAPPLGPVPGGYSPEGVPEIPAGEIMGAYRGGSYAYSGKGYYGVSAWSPQGYEDGVDYGLHGLGAAPKYEPGTNPLYLNLEPAYGYPSSSPSLVRPVPTPISAANPNFSLSTVAASMSQQLNSPGKDRTLPGPGPARGPAPYRDNYQAKVSSSAHGSPTVSSIAEVPAYTGYDGYASQSVLPAARQADYAHSPSSTRPEVCPAVRATDSYASSRASDPYSSGNDSMFSPGDASLKSQESGTELSYRYTDSQRDGPGAAGQLANGQVYTSLPPLTGAYMMGEVEERRAGVQGVSGVNAV